MKTTLICTLLLLLTSPLAADDIVPADSKLKAEVRVAFTEGPAWHPSGNVYFSDIANNRIMRRDRTGALHVYRSESGRTNGLCFDQLGRLLCCEGGGAESNRRVTRIELDGTITVLADSFGGKRINSPNDCTIDSKGRIYFTDPRYRSKAGVEQWDKDGNIIEGVYRIDAPGKVTRILTHEVQRPNGIAISPDENWLFVADNMNDGAGNNRKLWRFQRNSDGSVDAKSRKLLFDWGNERGPDGMAIDKQGRLYVTAGFNFPNPPAETANKFKAGVYVISPEGKQLGFIPVPIDMITNCAFGDKDFRTLYITAGHKLWSIRTNATGHVEWRNGESARSADVAN
ncbi:MAG: SMP-30/gluconolactonase/LRE family protein [Planctomycetes bacterium]|nr:SMP-30/gluconolactonase/LRE family protein [Planctomycetota bacterium]